MIFLNRCVKGILFIVAVSASSYTHAAPVSGQGTWETTLQARDFDGNTATIEGYYDTVLNITWLANANFAYGHPYDTLGGGYTDGAMTWNYASAWAANLSINGINGWRLPTSSPVDGNPTPDYAFSYNGSQDLGYNISAPGTLYAGSTASEMAHLFYNTLGDKSACDPVTSTASICSPQAGSGLGNTGPFSNVLSGGRYWSSSMYDTGQVLVFSFNSGYQDLAVANSPAEGFAWAVHSGDVGAALVPVPAAMWLFGSGLIGLFGFTHRMRQLI